MYHPVRSEPGTALRAGSSRSCCSLQANIQGLSGVMVLRQNLGEEMKLLAEAGEGWRAEVLDLESGATCGSVYGLCVIVFPEKQHKLEREPQALEGVLGRRETIKPARWLSRLRYLAPKPDNLSLIPGTYKVEENCCP